MRRLLSPLFVIVLVAAGCGADGAFTPAENATSTSALPELGDGFVHDEGAFADAQMASVTAGGPGLVAVGIDSNGTFRTKTLVWISPDGLRWSRVPHDEAVFGEATMFSVTAGGPGLVAVGFGRDRSAAVLTSPDGVVWSRVPHDEAVFGGGVMWSVTVGGPGFVAVGPGRGRATFGFLLTGLLGPGSLLTRR